jgi:hypothetical protein
MKTRDGFVSNSSSSSFIVCFPKVPSDVNELRKMLFGDEEIYQGPYGGEWSTRQVADTVWSVLRRQKPLSLREIAEEMDTSFRYGGTMESPPDPPQYPPELYGRTDLSEVDLQSIRDQYERDSDEWNREFEVWQKRAARKFIGDNPGQMFRFTFSDDDDYGAALEHGDVFAKLPHVRISNH